MTSQAELRDELQGMAALHTRLAKMDGYEIDKAAARFSAMADYMMQAGRCSAPFSEYAARTSLEEAVSTAIRGDPMNIPGQPFDASATAWMEATE